MDTDRSRARLYAALLAPTALAVGVVIGWWITLSF